jgi:thymidylate kinase
MLIIIEGADKTGKTTLAKAIAKRFGYHYYHSGPPKRRPADEYIDFLLDLKYSTVCDRFHLGELVYGPMFRGTIGINEREFRVIEYMLKSMKAILIYASTDIKLANKRLKVSKQQELVDNTMNMRAAMSFENVMKIKNSIPFINYDGSNKQNLDDILNKIGAIIGTVCL